MKITLVLVLSVSLVGGMLIHPAQGKDYPAGPIELLCPFPAGGSWDLHLRLIADRLSRQLGQPLVVVNKPGGAGSTIVADMISSKPDGYKIGGLAASYFSTVVKSQKVPFNPSHIIPIITFAELKVGLEVSGNSPWKTLGELVDFAKNNPGKLRWGHAGRGLTSYMSASLIFRKVDAETIDIPYKGAPESLSALMGGHIDATVHPYGTVAGHMQTGTIRCLVFFTDRRYSDIPNVPCALELGFPDAAKLVELYGIFAHKDTPENVRKILFDAFKKTFEDPEYKKGVEKIGDEPKFAGPELIAERIKEQEKITVPILKELGIYVGN
jgi:tripartite-type tricarboxylate transporter receptor subunit TctC